MINKTKELDAEWDKKYPRLFKESQTVCKFNEVFLKEDLHTRDKAILTILKGEVEKRRLPYMSCGNADLENAHNQALSEISSLIDNLLK